MLTLSSSSRVACMILGLLLASGALPQTQGGTGPPQDLKPGPGRDVVQQHCVSCHDASYVTTLRLTRAQWNQMVTEMVELQGMAEPSPGIRQIILDYLVETQSPEL